MENKEKTTKRSTSGSNEMAGLVRWLLEAIDASDAHAYCLDRAYRRNIKEVVMKSEQVARLRKLVGSDAE